MSRLWRTNTHWKVEQYSVWAESAKPKLTLRVPYTKMYIAITCETTYIWFQGENLHSTTLNSDGDISIMSIINSSFYGMYIICKQKWCHIVSLRWKAEHMLLSATLPGGGGALFSKWEYLIWYFWPGGENGLTSRCVCDWSNRQLNSKQLEHAYR